ncbi:GNAT family N-acetyltransferase [Vagococcus fluvialis]|uniref:GNAT family N-acetyltransferase n=1 Tax=Vagococcus fluvialis TaxID=2738 RepID=UPI001A8FE7A0|nr:GNAT family N-acetyltransferase [Vagococcus fluvialis]MBO0429567.1 GNAT family N-acetyltransferase [Vagococcus fluvialis]
MKDFTHPKFPTIHIKLLKGEHTEQLTKLLDGSTLETETLLNFIPENLTTDEKYLYGIFDESNLIGVIDLIEDYPTKQGAYIHQFFISEDVTDGLLAETLYQALEKTAQETNIISLELNEAISDQPLWNNLGFTDNKKSI